MNRKRIACVLWLADAICLGVQGLPGWGLALFVAIILAVMAGESDC